MPDEGSVEYNLGKGRGAMSDKDKSPFKVVGMGDQDKDHPEMTGDTGRRPGRPSVDRNWTQVQPDPKHEG